MNIHDLFDIFMRKHMGIWIKENEHLLRRNQLVYEREKEKYKQYLIKIFKEKFLPGME